MTQRVNAADHGLDEFIRHAVASGEVWGISHKKCGWAVCPSNEYDNTTVYLFWSDQTAAQNHCVDEWHDYQPIVLKLEYFVERWLHGMAEDGHLLGANWDTDLSGQELEPGDIAERLQPV